MRDALGGFAICVLLAACTGVADDVAPPTTPTTAPTTTTSTTAPTTTTTTPTTTTTVIGAGLLDGELVAAWNRGDLKTYWAFFAKDARWQGQLVGSESLAANDAWLQAIGWRYTFSDCERHSDAHATCRSTLTDDISNQAGIELRLSEDYWFNDDGRIYSYSDTGGSWTSGAQATYEALETWIAATYPSLLALWERGDPVAAAPLAASMAEFLEAFPEHRIGADPVVPEPVLTGSLDGVDVYNADPRQTALVSWALTRFAASRLEPPPVTAVRFPPTEACVRNFSGVTIHGNEGSMIDVCVAPEDLAIAVGFPLDARRTILHELGHVWNAHVATDAARQAFLNLRDLEEWNAAVWQESGSEQAAEIIMWGVMDMNVLPRVPNAACPDRHDAYETLTGIPAAERLTDCTGDS
ncbi:MAG: hypothetical protein ABFR89_11810 [Actinomycetota bacterium]